MSAALILAVVNTILELGFIIRVILRPNREPASRIAWIAVIAALPGVGILAYILLGEVNIGRRRIAKLQKVLDKMPGLAGPVSGDEANLVADVPTEYQHLFRMGQSINGFEPIGGNSARLMADSNATIDSMVRDMDSAVDHIHLLFYIWLTDNNGCKIVDALKRAAGRGVKCRAIIDDLGSRAMVKSPQWKDLQNAGVEVAVALPIGNPFVRILRGRVDLRNHRKIVVIDGTTTYCGSQNCADPEFRVKPKFAPWVDAVMRFEGPIARQNQMLFASDWMAYADEDIDDLLAKPIPAPQPGFPAQVIGTGPTNRSSAMPQMFETLIDSARQELVISTPYFVPDDSLLSSLCKASYRGVKTTIIFPERNDSWIVAGASRSYYPALLEAGVTIFEYKGGLLHTKSMTVDGDVTLIGSANMDRRSFDLNYENNILFVDGALTAELHERQQSYIQDSSVVNRDSVAEWSTSRRLWNNTLAMLGPVL